MAPPHLDWLRELFWRLSHFRPVSVGMSAYVGAVPYEALRCEAQRLGLEGDEYEHFFECMIAMDQGYLSIVNTRNKKAKEGK